MKLSFGSSLTADPRLGEFELVERKGAGHPDTLCDAISEEISRRYSQFCMKRFGRIPHHWFDKVMLIGGESDNRFGIGEMTSPYTVIVAGKCALAIGDVVIPVELIARSAAAEVLGLSLTAFDADRHLKLEFRAVDYTGPGRSSSRYRPADVDDLVAIGDPTLVSNDGNLVVGYAPFTPLEAMVHFTETYLNGSAFKTRHPDVGWDIKVFGTRIGQSIGLLVNVPFLAARIDSRELYQRRKDEVEQALVHALAEEWPDQKPTVTLNPADEHNKYYLLALGSVADTGDVGVTGRGNRINGLITPMRPMSIEAPAGKNPLDHTGKLLGVLADELAKAIHERLGVAVEVFMHIAKGTSIYRPEQVLVATERNLNGTERAIVEDLVEAALRGVPSLSARFVEPGITVW